MNLGFIGTGKITSSVVTGICRSRISFKKIILSPRNRIVAKKLKKQFRKVSIAKNNQEIVNSCNWVFLAVTPTVGQKIIKNLKFKSSQTIVSFISTMTLPQLKKVIKVKAKIFRAIPLPPISLKKGPIQPADYNYNDSHELRTETVTDTHHVHKVWTIKNWSGIPQNEGYILYDQEFSFVNHRWRLRLYPGGVTEQVKGYMSFYLDCRDATDEHPAHERHTFRVVNQLNPSKHWEQHSLPYKEHRDPDGWGWGKFLSHE